MSGLKGIQGISVLTVKVLVCVGQVTARYAKTVARVLAAVNFIDVRVE